MWREKNTDLILIFFFKLIESSLLNWDIGRQEMEMDEAEKCFLCSSLTSFVTW